MKITKNALTKIAIFYDGNYFAHVSHYYKYVHQRKARINLQGLHDFIRNEVSTSEETSLKLCKIVEGHYFRGRYSAKDSQQNNKLFTERQFEDILMHSGVITHHTPMTQRGEKGIDVWFALEALELSLLKKFDVVALVACDSDYVPLVKKLNSHGIRVIVLGWDFHYVDEVGEREYRTTTSQQLLDEATYPIMMHQVIDDPPGAVDPKFIEQLFVATDRPVQQVYASA